MPPVAASGGRALFSDNDLDWIREARLVDELVRAAMHRLGIPITNTKPFDELVASGELKAAECRVRSKEMVTPGWMERATAEKIIHRFCLTDMSIYPI